MRKIAVLVTRNPQKNYGRAEWSGIAGTILATDYKSPPLCLIAYKEEYGQDNADSRKDADKRQDTH